MYTEMKKTYIHVRSVQVFLARLSKLNLLNIIAACSSNIAEIVSIGDSSWPIRSSSWFVPSTPQLLLDSLRKHAYSNILKILPPKNENFQIKNSEIFHISAQNIDCWYSLEPPRRGGSNEYPQSMFLSRNKKNNIYPCKP